MPTAASQLTTCKEHNIDVRDPKHTDNTRSDAPVHAANGHSSCFQGLQVWSVQPSHYSFDRKGHTYPDIKEGELHFYLAA